MGRWLVGRGRGALGTALAAQHRDRIQQALDAVHARARNRQRLFVIGARHDHLVDAASARQERSGQAARHPSDAAVEGQLPEDQEIGEPVRGHVAVRRENPQSDRQVQARSLLAQVGRGQTDRDAARGHVESRVADGGAYPVGALAHRGVGQADRVDAGQAAVDVALDEQWNRFDAEERGAPDPGQHGRLRRPGGQPRGPPAPRPSALRDAVAVRGC